MDLQAATCGLESMVDSVGLVGVVEALSCICVEKAEHLRANWQDEASARDFERCMRVLDRCSASLRKLA